MTRWGILATGGIATAFVQDLRLLPDAEVVACGSRRPDTARAFADRHGIPRAHGTWADLANDPDVDVVYVATPHAFHHAATRACLDAGKPALCEKPFTLDRPTSAELIDLATGRGIFLMEAMWTRCNPVIRRLQALVADGAIGDVTTVHADFGIAGPFEPTHRMRARALGGGALLDLGVYPITIAHLFLGAPTEITAWGRLSPEGVDENTGLILGYPNGAMASLTCGILGATRNTASITGTRGRIDLNGTFFAPRGYTLYRNDTEPETVDMSFPGAGYHFEAAEVQRCLAEGLIESPLVPHATTLEIMGILDEIRAQLGVHYS
ncbi:Gfo/Idh/MocA family protein, partial [Rhizomonospora bruguierae]|uniref:Gfo/Idh/MocA family protein n=1 Tax=Rhizomonospora bruguierae TaxID=1581705 RepID=UPI001BCC1634